MDSSNKTKFNMDHVYCHTNTSSYIRANADAADVLPILKENKQLKAMLLLHLDLIQEQSDQLMSKDKLLATLREENEALKMRIERMDRRLQVKCTRNSESQMVLNNNIDKKVNIIENANVDPIENLASRTTPPNTTNFSSAESKYKICEDNYNNDSIIGEKNGKFISKIILQRVPAEETALINKDRNIELLNCDSNKSLVVEDSSGRLIVKDECIHNDTEEDSFSCGSGEPDRVAQNLRKVRKNIKRDGFITTKSMYCTREWEMEKIDDELNKEESETLKTDALNLEIPKWTVRDYTGLYSIEGTEDLSDDIFSKRHAKLEHDEKRRKKWDVQRIREQRTIERLKRRHCKDEIMEAESNNQEIASFYPSADSIKFIQITENLPVQAFGESIPRITATEFNLPWRAPDRFPHLITESKPTTIIFLKKRRRQCSQNTPGPSKRTYKRSYIRH